MPVPAASERLSQQLEAALLRELQSLWRDINYAMLHDALQPPVMRLVDAQQQLGCWDRQRRTIELSRKLVMEQSWGSVTEVLKHEMAHQYVHEVLGIVDESAHGPAFARACAHMGIDAAASGTPQPPPDDARSKAAQRIASLLALADSPNRHEAENAAALAQRLMLKHNIAVSQRPERQRYAYVHIGAPKGRTQEYEHILAAILSEYYFVEAVWVPGYRPHDGKRGHLLELCGTPENLDMAQYVYDFLLHTSERLWRQHQRERGITANRERRAYLAGVMEGFRERLASASKRSAERGLVWLGDADLKEYYRCRHPHLRSVSLRGHGYSSTRQHGRDAGRKIVLRRGITNTGASGPTRALPPKRR